MLPSITHLQFVILSICLGGEQSGREIREQLAKYGIRKSGPAFYQLMARLEGERLVAGAYTEKMVDSQRIKERRYRITGAGEHAWNQTRVFYLAVANRLTTLGVGHA